MKAAGVAPERCIHTHPIKSDADIRAALRFGIHTFVADNPDEIRKFVRHRRRAELLLRVSFRNPSAVVDLSRKFGCEPAAVPPLLELARSLGVRVTGLSFHVGSQVADPAKYVEAIGACARTHRASHASGLAELEMLDIGGGFPIPYRGETVPIGEFCRADPPGAASAAAPRARHRRAGAIHRGTGRHRRLPPSSGARSARAAGGTTSTMACMARTAGSCSITRAIRSKCSTGAARMHPSVLAGPTCDSIDVVREDFPLPELQIGDLVVGRMMGAYTCATCHRLQFHPARAHRRRSMRMRRHGRCGSSVVDHVAGRQRAPGASR